MNRFWYWLSALLAVSSIIIAVTGLHESMPQVLGLGLAAITFSILSLNSKH